MQIEFGLFLIPFSTSYIDKSRVTLTVDEIIYHLADIEIGCRIEELSERDSFGSEDTNVELV